MPRVKRWFNVSQTINRDPEVKELKRAFGLAGFSMWLEVLAETDGTDGLWKGSETDIRRVLAGVCDSNTRGSARVLNWVADRGWMVWEIGSEEGNRRNLKVVNHAKYHPTRDDKQIPSREPKEKSIVSPPSFPSEPSEHNSPKGSQPDRLESMVDGIWKVWPPIKRKSKGGLRKALRKLNPSPELFGRILAKIELLKKSSSWKKDNGQFIPYPASWINAEGWEDEVDDFLGVRKDRMPI